MESRTRPRASGRFFRASVLSPQSSVLRSGFTLIELLVVIGVILVIMGLLFPAIVGVNRSAKIKTQRLDFRAIVGALEAYRQDFRDYPKDPFAMTDGVNVAPITYTSSGGATAALPDIYRPVPFHTDPTLAMALLGLGPASAIGAAGATVGYPYGDVDGADGPGFKAKMAVVGTGTVSAMAGAGLTGNPISVKITSINLASNTLTAIPSPTSSPAFTVITLGGPGSPDALVPITSATAASVNSSSSITLARPLLQSYTSQSCALLAPAGATYGPYLPPDKFKVQYVMVTNPGHSSSSLASEETQALPVLLDVWGGPILYFPAYNAYQGRNVSNSPTAANSTPGYPVDISAPPMGAIVTSGPIFGSPAPNTASIAKNAPIDNSGDTIPSIFWSGPLGSWGTDPAGTTPYLNADPAVPLSQGQIQGILLKLGDVDGNNVIDNTPLQERFNLQLPYFLVSPGPDGKFEDPQQDAINDKVNLNPGYNPAADAAIYMPKSDDVYDFDQ